MLNIFLGIIVFHCARCLGQKILRLFRLPLEPDEAFVFASGIGFGLMAYSVLLLGLAGCLNVWSLRILTAAAFVLCLPSFRSDCKDFFKALACWKWRPGFPGLLIFFASGAALLALLAGILAPETANDSLCYHLHLAKIFLKEHRVGYLPLEFNSLFPLFMEMLDTLALGLGIPGGHPFWGGMILAKFLHAAMGLIGATAILSVVRRYARAEWAWFGALLWLTTPLVINQMGTTYVDVPMAVYCLLGLLALLRWFDSLKSAWLALSGVFLGLAMSIKYLAAIVILGAAAAALWSLLTRSGKKEILRGVFYFAAAIFIFGGYWYVRSYLELGNPVYPYFYQLFKSGDPTIHYNDIGVPRTLLSFLMLPWTITMHPEIFEGYGVQIGPAVLALLPATLVARRKKIPHPGFFIFFSFFYLAAWFFLGQSMRFLLPLLPILLIVIAIGLSGFDDESGRPVKIERGVLHFLLVLIFFMHAGLSLYHYRHDFRVALGLESKPSYMDRVERSYGVAAWVNENLPPQSKILCADESHLHYYDRTVARENVYSMRTGYENKVQSLAEAAEWFKKEGFTHLLISEGQFKDAWKENPPFRITRLAREKENELALYFDAIYTKRFRSSDGNEILYKLYHIK